MEFLKKRNIIKYVNIALLVLILIFFSLGIYFNMQMKKNLQVNVEENLKKDSQIMSSHINFYFIHYGEIVNQMQTNETLISYIKETKSRETKKISPKYKEVVNTLGVIKNTDENLFFVWLGVNAINDVVIPSYSFNQPENFKIDTRPWYIEMIENKSKITYTTPYIDAITGEVVISIVAPVYDDDKVLVGNTGIDINIAKVKSFLESYSIGKNGHVVLVSNKGKIIYSTDEDFIYDTNIIDKTGALGEISKKMIAGESGVTEFSDKALQKYFAYEPIKSTDWSVCAIVSKSETQEQTNIFNLTSMLIFGAATIILIVIAIIIKISNNYEELNNLYKDLEIKDNELKFSNQEISAAYEQLAASEEELRSQYDEIQTYSDKIQQLAFHDPLTNLPNRRGFMEKFNREVSLNHDSTVAGAVMLIDLDNFKGINDTLGHVFGDQVLKRVAEELLSIVDDKLFLSRFGGDEFLILISGESNILKIQQYAENIIQLFKNKLIIDENEIYISCSIGISTYPTDSIMMSQLLMNADIAMYKVKATEKNNYLFFDCEMTEKVEEKTKIAKILRQAVDEDGFKIVYQPQVDTFTGNIIGFEALIRMKNYNISPALFIPVAEEIGMIIEIGRWVTKEVIRQISKWKSANLDIKPIAINFSAKQLNDLTYYEFLEAQLNENLIEPKYIDLEITESIFLEKRDETIKFLNKLKVLGLTISLDDFGTGYSSLSYLTFLPVDKLKLDKSLKDKFLQTGNMNVLKYLIAFAHSLNLKVVAEGIEDFEEYKYLKTAQCDYIQGYLFSKPIDASVVEEINNINYLTTLKS